MSVRTKKKASTSNRFGMAVIAAIVALLLAVMLMQSYKLNTKIITYRASNQSLQEQIKLENDRAGELEKLPEYIQSDEYIEKIAREKFGLVYPDETVFEAQQ